MTRQVLVVEDNRDLAQLLELHLSDAGYCVHTTHDGLDGLRAATTTRFDAMILDIMLPGLDGLEVCRRLRALGSSVALLMLTSRASELDRVLGLEIGADDYLTKPFSIPELLARVKALLRRTEPERTATADDTVLRCGNLAIDLQKRNVTNADRSIELTAREFDLLVHFARHPGRVYTRAQLLDQVWGYGHDGYEHTVNSHINRLRAKIERDPTQPEHVLTVWGVGYKFTEDR